MSSESRRSVELGEENNSYQSHFLSTMPPLTSGRRPSENSMLAYSQRMREINRLRMETTVSGTEHSPEKILEIQARHIPKTQHGLCRVGQGKSLSRIKPRRPMSLDELIGRPGKKEPTSSGKTDPGQKDRPMSDPIVIPSVALTSPREKEKEEKRIQISFVSTADLFDLVDFSLRSRKSRPDHAQLARAEDTLRLIKEANIFRSLSTRQRMKARADKDTETNALSMVVQGTSSPKQRTLDNKETLASVEKDSNRNKKDVQENTDSNNSDDEDDDDNESSQNWDQDMVQQRKLMLLLPPKLRFRPKRAKRMRLHRSVLSAIPEDGRQARDRHASQSQDSMIPGPVIPTSASLAAIKGSKEHSSSESIDIDTKKAAFKADKKTGKHPDLILNSFQTINEQNVTYAKDKMLKQSTSAEPISQNASPHMTQGDQHGVTQIDMLPPQKKSVSHRRTTPGGKPSVLSGHSISLDLTNSRIRAQKKIKKLVYLREQSDHRYS